MLNPGIIIPFRNRGVVAVEAKPDRWVWKGYHVYTAML